MAPRDHTNLSLHWEFLPSLEGRDRAVHWRWQAFDQTGRLYAQSQSSFESLTECIDDARRHGYTPPAG